MSKEYHEKKLEEALVNLTRKFLLELGTEFSNAGRKYALQVGGKEFTIDRLFYHLKLRCFVVIELKTGEFVPEYAGKRNFYLSVTDDLLKHTTHNVYIGILICKERNDVEAAHALCGINKLTIVRSVATPVL